ncbi:MAG: hypothetical protein IJT94_11425, partial [Oscillibacter sp.]|nr:hypothetical protein [Oscillibacter sp.]
LTPLETIEAAVFLLESGGKYQTAYDAFLSLYAAGQYREEILHILLDAFHTPNVKDLRKRYEKNGKALRKYPWLFHSGMPSFDELPLLFFPYDDDTYVPFDTRTGTFLPKVKPRYEEITHYFFRDLEKPVLAQDIFSQYELEYLVDNVRLSEDIGRENHVYLHYSEWEVFCAWLQVWDLRRVLKSKKAVFLFGEELDRYPLDFKKEFGIDYSQYPVKPVRIREVCKLIWHTQFSTHNGGDFYNEIFDSHPNLLYFTSTFLDDTKRDIDIYREALHTALNLREAQEYLFAAWNNPQLVRELFFLKKVTDKDLLIARFLSSPEWLSSVDAASRIVPAVFFQPHFSNMKYGIRVSPDGKAVLSSGEAAVMQESEMIKGFRYIKTFTPIRRFTNSYGASLRYVEKFSATYEFAQQSLEKLEEDKKELGAENMRDGKSVVTSLTADWLGQRVRNQSFMRDPDDRLYRDSVMVRLEDGKLNPEATLTRLAEFLDLPYTHSMTYCSAQGKRDPVPQKEAGHYSVGFSLKSVYDTFDEYVDPWQKRYIEYLLRDAYAYFGYDFQVYDGAPVDRETMLDWISRFSSIWELYRRLHVNYNEGLKEACGVSLFPSEEEYEEFFATRKQAVTNLLIQTADAIMSGIRFVNKDGKPLGMIPLLKPDPDLLVKPLYR